MGQNLERRTLEDAQEQVIECVKKLKAMPPSEFMAMQASISAYSQKFSARLRRLERQSRYNAGRYRG